MKSRRRQVMARHLVTAFLCVWGLALSVPAQDDLVKIVASDGAAGDRFGEEIAVDGDVLVVGAIFHDGRWTNSGAAYVFRRHSDTWLQEAELDPTRGFPAPNFGTAVAVEGDLVVVGFPEYGSGSGAAFVYKHDGVAWHEQAMLVAPDGRSGDDFGRGVAVSGDRLLIGAHHWGNSSPGVAYVFRSSGSGWVEEARLRGSDAGAFDYFGARVALDGDVAVVTAIDYGDSSGAAYVFRRTGSTWSEEAKLTPSDNAAGDRFGADVSLDGDVLVIGAHGNDDLGSDSGSAYVYRHDGLVWREEAKLLPSHGGSGHEFGFSAAIRGDVAVIGAPGDSQYGWRTGSAYVFRRIGGRWSEVQRLLSPDAASGDHSGFDTAIGSDFAAFSTRADAGAVYLDMFDGAANHAPVADAGADRELECTSPGGTRVTLDGSGSTDADSTPGTNDITRFAWFAHYGTGEETPLGEGETVDARFAPGTTVATLEVTDAGGLTDTDEAVIRILDTTPPRLRVTVSPNTLWPANHRMVPVTATITVSDACDSTPDVRLLSISSNEPAAAGGEPDIQGATLGTDDREFQLRAERQGGGGGRVYTIVYLAIDDSGNPMRARATVTVPHDQRDHAR